MIAFIVALALSQLPEFPEAPVVGNGVSQELVDGYQAQRRGVDSSDVPYPVNTWHREQWYFGWSRAKHDYQPPRVKRHKDGTLEHRGVVYVYSVAKEKYGASAIIQPDPRWKWENNKPFKCWCWYRPYLTAGKVCHIDLVGLPDPNRK